MQLPGNTRLYCGTVGSNEVAVMECGIGKVNAAIGAVTLIDYFHPDLLISTGVAAGAGENVAVLDTVVASGVAHHDFWCIGEEWGQVPGCPRVFPTLTAENILGADEVKRGIIASGDMFITSREQVDAITGHYPDALAIDMESSAVAQAAYLRGVPCLCMRVISDTPWCHHDNTAQYESFWDDAPRRSFALLSKLIENL
ncbi:MAG: 5'-methylthioadenosine/S-adenosylhomocysteine nucleosidase [Duncaniella sp.]|nr:5'-methylthioadenosine/S-adenosylhomocysteine nucleosidase [Duncaniella sp.]